MILFVISFVAGVLTILAPCTLPLLPVIIGSSLGADGKEKKSMKKAFVIVGSLGVSIILFTFALKASTVFINIPQSAWSVISGIIILSFGLVSLFPDLWERIPLVQKLNISSNKLIGKGYLKKSLTGDILIGASLGPVFSTCSPTYFIILATVLPQSFLLGLVYLLAYTAGLVGVLLLIAFIGQRTLGTVGDLSNPHGKFKKILGVFFIIIGILVISGVDKQLESRLLSSGFGDITKVEQKLLSLNDKSMSSGDGDAPAAPEIANPSGFINTDGKPVTIAEFKGKKVVLLDIWTYSCINCQRTIPYLVAWDEKYRDAGLEIIGLHTPEFAFEKLIKNVENAVGKFGIKYPVVLDNDYATWNAFGNQYWPRKYLISVDGNIVYDHIGEGDYEATEREIQKALARLKEATGSSAVIPMDIVKIGSDGNVQASKVGSPEIYFGAARNSNLGNGFRGKTGIQKLSLPGTIFLNQAYLEGIWNFGEEEAKTLGPAKISFQYDAKNVYMVASSDLPEGTEIIIKKDGVELKKITIKENTLYPIVEATDYGIHLLEIEIPGAGFSAFTFTFG